MNVDAEVKECRKARTGSAASGTPRRAIKIYIGGVFASVG